MLDFDITGELPAPGTTLLEASAGTGKTWTIAALVARYLAEDVLGLDQMLVVTFGRAASQELRTRVRERLVEVAEALESGDPGEDPLLRLLLDVDADERARRLARVRAALTGFDGAAILTIHQFCHTVLRGLGVAGDTDPNAKLVEDLDELLEDVVDDLYLSEVAGPEVSDPVRVARTFPHTAARRLGHEAAIKNPLARLEPRAAVAGSDAARRVRFAEAVRAEFGHRKRRGGVLSYDDLLQQLADALADPESPARQRMRERWQLVLVDEFQDTDPTQWAVFERAFHQVQPGHQPTTLVLIGDPKQAIYAFRGGDVFTYLRARAAAGSTATLSQNFRTDRAVLEPINVLLQGAQLGHPDIVVHPASAHHGEHRLSGPRTDPFRLRALTRDMVERADPEKLLGVSRAREIVAADLAAEVLRMLQPTSAAEQVTFDGRRLEPGDIAVLAYSRKQLHTARAALAARGIASVMAGAGSVFDTTGAANWLTLLEALEQPHRSDRVRAAALTPFFGHTLDSLVAAGEAETERLATVIRDWLDLFRARGVAAVFTAAEESGLEARLLGRINGDRELTDLRHVAEVLHRESVTDGAGVVALVTWLREQMRERHDDVAGERTRRLDSDAHAVQLATIHGSKGLEYPVVLLPFTFDRYEGRGRDDLVAYHDDDGERVLDVGGGRDRDESVDERARAEELGERLRLLYVAMTRTQAQLVMWWAPTNNTATAELQRVLLGRRPGQAEVPDRVNPGDDAEAVRWLRAWAGKGAFVLERVDVDPAPGSLAPEPSAELSIRAFRRDIDHGWRRTSYTALSTPAQEAAAVGSEPDLQLKDDEAEDDQLVLTVAAADPAAVPALPSPMAELPTGAQFGSLVHAVLEHADPQAPDLRAELRRCVEEQWLSWPLDVDRDVLADALVEVCRTPLGPAAAGATLADIGHADRLCELEFELPLAGGDRNRDAAGPRLADLAPLLRSHLPDGDPVRGWADALANPLLGEQDLRGYLTGSVDVVLRVGRRHLVVDYKTNWLGAFGEPLTTADYTPAALDAAMGHSDYPLQALLYAVVLHRFLRWRLPDYDPDTHLGGVLYLYLRGMAGPDTPIIDDQPCGVFTWQPPVALVLEVSQLLDGGAR